MEENKELVKNLEILYSMAEKYRPNNSVMHKNNLVMQYLRSESNYTGFEWDLFAGKIDREFVNNVKNSAEYSEKLLPKNIRIYINEYEMEIEITHLAATLNTINMYGVNTPFADIAGWAGDLISFITKIDSEQKKSGKKFEETELYTLLGGKDARKYDFDLEDFIQDIDAVSIGSKLKEVPINKAFEEYYNKKNRFELFAEKRLDISNKGAYASAYETAYEYTSQSNFLAMLLANMNGAAYNATEWGEKAAKTFASKIANMIELEAE
jgi:hypothetical protein